MNLRRDLYRRSFIRVIKFSSLSEPELIPRRLRYLGVKRRNELLFDFIINLDFSIGQDSSFVKIAEKVISEDEREKE